MEYSHHLPPLEAWKRPDEWVDLETGRARQDVQKIPLPVDDRNLLQPGEAVEMVNDMLFWPDYDWSEGQGRRMKGDVHHFYHPAAAYDPEDNLGDELPKKFRELPTLMGRMPRRFHNTLHAVTEIPAMPTYEVMRDYTHSYQLAKQAFSNLIRTAEETLGAARLFRAREADIALGRITPHDPSDTIAKEFLRDFFARHFAAYSEIAEIVRDLPARELLVPDFNEAHLSRPRVISRKIGRSVIRSHINYMPYLLKAA